jgi:methylmalonyl-CoA/ethylmalonyl-CoA epimerase
MAKLRHLAIIVDDPEKSATFFEAAFGMTRTGVVRCGFHLSDGVMTVAVLKKETPEERIGIDHFGMWVDDFETAREKATAAGAVYIGGAPVEPTSFYEAKYKTPEGIVFDLSHTGWPGAVKDPVTGV